MTDVHNNVTSTAKYMEFKTFTESLIDAGLDTEKIKATRTPTAGASISTTCEELIIMFLGTLWVVIDRSRSWSSSLSCSRRVIQRKICPLLA
jgi:hypothetical protein